MTGVGGHGGPPYLDMMNRLKGSEVQGFRVLGSEFRGSGLSKFTSFKCDANPSLNKAKWIIQFNL